MLMIKPMLFSLLLVACNSNDATTALTGQGTETEDNDTTLLSRTMDIPAEYTQRAALKGSIVQIDYATKNYVDGNGEARTNTAYVYLPHEYDESSHKCYNILYYVHGHGDTAASLFENEDGAMLNLLDQMISKGEIAPTIVVSTSYVYGTPVDYYPDADPYCRALPQELVNDLIPAVESRFHTYAQTADSAGLKATRSHRAIGGFSMGAVATWYAFEQALGYFGFFMPISSDSWALGPFAGNDHPEETAAHLADIARSAASSENDFRIWACSGTEDVAYGRIWTQVQAMAKLTDAFPLSRLTFHEQEGARHDFNALPEYFYNALPVMFPR